MQDGSTPNTLVTTLIILGHAIKASALPEIPADRQQVFDEVDGSTWRIPENLREQALNGLREVAERQADLGPLAPSPANCAAMADELDSIYDVLAKLEGLKEYVEARRAILEPKADAMLHAAGEEANRHIKCGLVSPQLYRAARNYADAHSVAITNGIARAARARTQMKREAPANDAQPQKTGTDNR